MEPVFSVGENAYICVSEILQYNLNKKIFISEVLCYYKKYLFVVFSINKSALISALYIVEVFVFCIFTIIYRFLPEYFVFENA